jgi:hypothetical protein
MAEQCLYDRDIVAWAEQQAAWLRSGRLDLLDLENLADAFLMTVLGCRPRSLIGIGCRIKWVRTADPTDRARRVGCADPALSANPLHG